MNAPIEPLEPDVVDELWSAELDGEFDAAAADLGLSVDEARARLAATAGADARRQTLEQARDALRAPVAPLSGDAREETLAFAAGDGAGTDELARRRSRRPSVGRLAGFAVAAAAILLVVGLAVSIASTGSDKGDDSSASGAGGAADAATSPDQVERRATEGLDSTTAPAAAAQVPRHAFGTVDDEATLRARVADALGLGLAPSATGTEEDAGGESAEPDVGVTDACLTLQADNFGVGPTPTLRGPVEYQGTAAEVLVFAQGDDSLTITVATGDCRLLVSLFVHPES